jgi:hypothetical protein
MKKLLLLPLLLAATPLLAQTSPLDGDWRGVSDGGSCNAPLDYRLSIDTGIVDGTSTDATARGPVPNPRKTAPPPPTPGLWQIHGVARGNSFSLSATASVKSEDRRSAKLSVSLQGATLVVAEQGGCRRTATLTKN